MEQNKVEILEALNNEKMYSLRGDEVGEMCSPEGDDTQGKSQEREGVIMEQNKVEILEALNNEKMYSLRGDEVGEMCSPEGDDTRGDGSTAFPQKARRTYQRKS